MSMAIVSLKPYHGHGTRISTRKNLLLVRFDIGSASAGVLAKLSRADEL